MASPETPDREQPRRVLFLKLDGVVHAGVGLPTDFPLFAWVPELARILDGRPDVGIVLYCDWQEQHGIDRLRALLSELAPRQIEATGAGAPADVIRSFLKKHPWVEDWLILDERTYAFSDEMRPRVVVCDPQLGVTDAVVKARLRAWLDGRVPALPTAPAVSDDDLVDPVVQRLVGAHPLLFCGRLPEVPSHLPEGWYAIVNDLCFLLESELGREGGNRVTVQQIKEKFGGLRFYLAYSGEEDEGDEEGVPDRPGAAPSEAFKARVRSLIEAATRASEETCQWCGAAAAERDVDGYITTLCQEHYGEALRRRHGAGRS